MKKVLSKIIKFLFGSRIRKIISAVVIVIIGVIIFFNQKSSKPANLFTVKSQTFAQTITASGTITARRMATLKFQTPSLITWVGIKKGDQVNAYQAVATLDMRTLEKNLSIALLNYSEQRNNFDQKQVDNQERTPYSALNDDMKRILQNNQYDLDKSVRSVELSDLAKKQAVLVTPFSGIVVDDGGLVAGQNLSAADLEAKAVKIIDMSSMYFQAKVDEVDYAKVKNGQTVSLTLDAFPGKTFTGKVTYVGQQGVKSTSGSINILVDVTLDPFKENLVTDLNGEAVFTVAEIPNSLAVPANYVYYRDNKPFIKVVSGGKTAEKAVTLGSVSGELTQVISGLSSGDQVIQEK